MQQSIIQLQFSHNTYMYLTTRTINSTSQTIVLTLAFQSEMLTPQKLCYRIRNRDLWCLINSSYKNIRVNKNFLFLKFSQYLFCIFEKSMNKHQYFIIIYELFSKIQNKQLKNSKNGKILYSSVFLYKEFIEHHKSRFRIR